MSDDQKGTGIQSATWGGVVSGSVAWTYDADFRVATETITAGADTSTVSFGYDGDSLMVCASPTNCSPASSDAMTLSYDGGNGLPLGSTVGSVTEAFTHSQFGELATQSASHGATQLLDITYDDVSAPRDNLGRIQTKTDVMLGVTKTHQYGYDGAGRLENVWLDGAPVETYTYDGNGNRLSLTTPGGTINATYDDQDRLLTYGDNVYTYTANGELLSKTHTPSGDVTSYVYDVRGNLRQVTLPNGDVITYEIDGQDRRVAKRVNGTLTRQFIWKDQLRIAAELDGTGALVSRFVYGQRHATTPEYVLRGGQTYRVVSDHLGSPRIVVNVNNAGDMPVQVEYSAFGEVTGTGIGWLPHGFAGGLYDGETGFVRFGARDYDAEVGRWTAKDPIRYGGGVNLYEYGLNNPLSFIDASGKIPCDAAVAGAGIGVGLIAGVALLKNPYAGLAAGAIVGALGYGVGVLLCKDPRMDPRGDSENYCEDDGDAIRCWKRKSCSWDDGDLNCSQKCEP